MNNRHQRASFFLVVWFTMFSFLSGWGQNFSVRLPKQDFSHIVLPGTKNQEMSHNPDYIAGTDLAYGILFVQPIRGNAVYPVKMNRIQTPPAIFCKMEAEMEKAIHLPLRVRVGSLAECDALEGKH